MARRAKRANDVDADKFDSIDEFAHALYSRGRYQIRSNSGASLADEVESKQG
jgi:hypothetical protein